MAYCVYILSSIGDTALYIGVTDDLLRRLWEHRNDAAEGFTRRYRVHKLVYYEQTADVQAALAREKQLKHWSRAKKDALIDTMNPDRHDLAGDWFTGTKIRK